MTKLFAYPGTFTVNKLKQQLTENFGNCIEVYNNPGEMGSGTSYFDFCLPPNRVVSIGTVLIAHFLLVLTLQTILDLAGLLFAEFIRHFFDVRFGHVPVGISRPINP